MKYQSIAFLIFSLCVPAAVLAQSPGQNGHEEIVGTGTPSFLARFTGLQRIGDSRVFQAPDGGIGIGTTSPSLALTSFQPQDGRLGRIPSYCDLGRKHGLKHLGRSLLSGKFFDRQHNRPERRGL